MKKVLASFCVVASLQLAAQDESFDSTQYYIDQVESGLTYETGEITFDSVGTIQVPAGFRFLDAEQSAYVLTKLWGNPNGDCLGMLVPEDVGVMSPDSWVFVITYDVMGYVKDEDADDIDYADLMSNMKEEMVAENSERKNLGYEEIELVGWASTPFYDADKKILHWAKEIRFGQSDTTTLNYNVRILGRKGVLVMNAVATMNELEVVKQNIDKVHSSFAFGDGLQYKDFDPEIDEVAAWTIGGLVAGKMLAKVGILAFLLKYIKLIGIGLFALGAGALKWFKARKQTQNPYASRDDGRPKTRVS
jgi:uncharacterized membrane-anchored protein